MPFEILGLRLVHRAGESAGFAAACTFRGSVASVGAGQALAARGKRSGEVKSLAAPTFVLHCEVGGVCRHRSGSVGRHGVGSHSYDQSLRSAAAGRYVETACGEANCGIEGARYSPGGPQ